MQDAPLLSPPSTRILASLVFLASTLILIGWYFNINILTRPYQGWPDYISKPIDKAELIRILSNIYTSR